MTILEEIVAYKRNEVEQAKAKIPVGKLEASSYFGRTPLIMTDYLLSPDKTGIIAEFKRRSPSKGLINGHSTVEEVSTGYFRSGASALSVLTDQHFFGGSAGDLKRARELTPIPILRKDFVIDAYQLFEAKAMGADAVLLIAAVLQVTETRQLAQQAQRLGLQVLLEVHEMAELDHINEYVDMVGINNRDLRTFVVDTERSVQLVEHIPADCVKISESGITAPLTIKRLRGCGYQGFLIGEHFMRSPEPARAFSDFVQQLMFEND